MDRWQVLFSVLGLAMIPWTATAAAPLQIVCPANIAVRSDHYAVPVVVNYAAPSVTGGTPPITVEQFQGLPSGWEFPAGVTMIGFGARDSAGHMATCSFTVTVTEPPPTAATLTVAPVTLDFDAQPPGSSSAPRLLALTNPGDFPLTLQGTALSGPGAGSFRLGGSLPASLAPGAGGLLPVIFAPTSTLAQTAYLTIRHNGSGGSVTVQLTGRGELGGGVTTPPQTSDWPVFMQGPRQPGRTGASPDLATLPVAPWSLSLASKPGLSPVIFAGVAYVGTEANGLFAFDLRTRTQLWNQAVPVPVRSAPAAGADVVVVSANGLLGLSLKDGGVRWQRPDLIAADTVSPMRVGEVIYLGAPLWRQAHELYAILAGHTDETLDVGGTRWRGQSRGIAARRTDFGDELLEAGRGRKPEQLAGRVAHVLEGMGDAPGAMNHGAGRGREGAIPHAELERALQNIERLVLAGMDVRRRAHLRRDGGFHRRERPLRLLARDLNGEEISPHPVGVACSGWDV